MSGPWRNLPLGRGVLYYVGASAGPVAFAVVAIPLLAAALGAVRFGVLALAWALLTYAGFLNLGIGRAVVHAVAGRSDADRSLTALVWTAILLLAGLGVAGGAALFGAAPWLGGAMAGLDPALASETVAVLRILSAALPFTLPAAALVGILEARQRFGAVNAVAVPLSAVYYFGPLAALQVSEGLVPVAVVLVLGRTAACAAYFALALRALPALGTRPVFDRRLLRPLLAFGGWISVSQVVSPLMVYADRFVVGALLSTVAVARYATPQEAVLRLGALSGAVTAVLFPAFAAARDPGRVTGLMYRGVAAVFLLCFPVTVLAGAFAGEVLNAWLGPAYAAEGAAVLRWLAVGLLVNGLAKVPGAFLAGGGRPDLPARLHLIELPAYAALVWGLTAGFGIQGAAAAWVARAAADAAALYWLAARQLPELSRVAAPAAVIAASGAAAVLGLAWIHHPGIRLIAAAAVLAVAGAVAWNRLLGDEGRAAVAGAFAGRGPRS